MGQEHKDFEGLLSQGGNDSEDKTVHLKELTISMTCFATIAVGSDKETEKYQLKMTSCKDGRPVLLEWHPKAEEGPINLHKMKVETTLAKALRVVIDDVKKKMTRDGEPNKPKKAGAAGSK